jgi:hypothetical protein
MRFPYVAASGFLGRQVDRFVFYHGGRGKAFFQGSRINEWLEAGTRLTPGLGYVIEFISMEVEPPN